MDELSQAEIEELQADLLALREDLQAALVQSADGAKTVDLDQPIGRLSRMDAIQSQQIARAGRRAMELRLRQVAAALEAVHEGVYGDCRRCDCPIGLARLKARPEAPFCVECQGASERRA